MIFLRSSCSSSSRGGGEGVVVRSSSSRKCSVCCGKIYLYKPIYKLIYIIDFFFPISYRRFVQGLALCLFQRFHVSSITKL